MGLQSTFKCSGWPRQRMPDTRKKNDVHVLSLTFGLCRVLESEEDRSCLDRSYTIMKKTRQIINRGSEWQTNIDNLYSMCAWIGSQ